MRLDFILRDAGSWEDFEPRSDLGGGTACGGFLLDQVSGYNRLAQGRGAEWSDSGDFESGAGGLCLGLDVGWGGVGGEGLS